MYNAAIANLAAPSNQGNLLANMGSLIRAGVASEASNPSGYADQTFISSPPQPSVPSLTSQQSSALSAAMAQNPAGPWIFGSGSDPSSNWTPYSVPTLPPAPSTQTANTIASPFQNINTSGINPYITDPLFSSYYGMQSPYFQQQQPDFYGDPELFRPPSVSGIGR